MKKDPLDYRDVQKLKAEGRYYHAGALAAVTAHSADYGCHFGMRSTLERSRAAYRDGYEQASWHLTKGDVPFTRDWRHLPD